MTCRPIVLAPLLFLAACSTVGEGDFPSLAVRPQEKMGFAEPEAPAPVAVVADSALDARIAALARDRVAAAAAFDAAATAAERAAGRTAAPGSDAWLDAQTALGGLDVARGRQEDATAALEELAAARAAALEPAYPPLDAAILTARTEAAARRERADRIAARLR
ncbi:hypothetical protein ASG29_10300 [Sphingomonas sp. Leaf412]|uniref:hypothetical protein n=1 Tax=Sphingomonas sp. Leaf412 TaxID=1736370 RepID=UPI000727A68B|nr:hypothetical protein [Sphingomonas sp. Leaf412]KQT32209.1 hypothetical protein ASG29_10300 [Sphingomonas sp. Leaf412]